MGKTIRKGGREVRSNDQKFKFLTRSTRQKIKTNAKRSWVLTEGQA